MCSLDIYNWYENRFPDDFHQLIKIKHYNISELSFLLSKVWYKLDYGEKLLMCAVYYDDFNLAKQMLNENIMFRVNPFLSKRYMAGHSSFPHKTRFSSSSSMTTTAAAATSNGTRPAATMMMSGGPDEHDTCWCNNTSSTNNNNNNSKPSFKSQTSVQDGLEYNEASYGSGGADSTSFDDMELNFNSTTSPHNLPSDGSSDAGGLSYFFNQRLDDNKVYSPFYLAVKLNKLKMCQLFVDYMRHIYHTSHSGGGGGSHIKSKHSLYSFYHHTKCSNGARFHLKVHLSHFLDEAELVNLFVLTLVNHNFELAALILNNCEKPKLVLNFYNLSESFIKNREFCLYLMRSRMVEPNILLKVATNRHQLDTTCYLLDHLEQTLKLSERQLIDLYKIVLFNSISIGDFYIFDMIVARIMSNCRSEQRALLGEITIDGILSKRYTSSTIKYKVRSCIDVEATRTLAASESFDFDAFVGGQTTAASKLVVSLPKLTYFNRLKLVKYLFNTEQEETPVYYSAKDFDKIKQVTICFHSLEKKRPSPFLISILTAI
jgi:hypothetical protein